MPTTTPSALIRRYLLDRRDEMIKLTGALCAIATENPPGREYESCVDFLNETAKSFGLKTKKVRVPKAYQIIDLPPDMLEYPRFNLICRWNTGAKKTIHFNSHYDVVPVTDDWKTDPFSPVLKGGKLYGRGTSDMKGSLVASLYAVKAMRECGLTPPWNVELSFTADEEIGGECGVGYLVKKRIVCPDAAVICEGGAEDYIMYGHRGVLWADVLVKGVSAHGSRPHLGVNAFEKGMDLARRFRDLQKQYAKRKTAYPVNHPAARTPTMTLGGVSGGGSKVNTIPDSFHFTIDRRLIPEERISDVTKELKQVIQDARSDDKKLKAKLRVMKGFNAGITEQESDICKIAKRAVESVHRRKAETLIFGAFTDLHFFTNEGHCPTVGYGVAGDGIHGCKEYVLVKSLVETARVYAEIALNADNAI